jgi:hypothetical protein
MPDAATIETMGALIVEALRPVVVARSTDASRHTLAPAIGSESMPPDSVWAYLSVRGGIDVAPVLGSRSPTRSVTSGPAPLRTTTC